MIGWSVAILLTLGVGDRVGGRTIAVDVLEHNTLYNSQCEPVFEQIIAWRFMPEDGEFHNVGWRMMQRSSDAPVRCGRVWSVVVVESRGMVQVIAPIYRRSHSQRDPERYDSATYWAGTPPNVFVVCDKERTNE